MAGDEQEERQSPSKVARRSSDTEVTMAAPSLALMMGLRVDGSRPAMTFMQMQELQQQALIYKYMVAGVPVPLDLVLPIWKSAAAASAPGVALRFPTLMGWGSLWMEYGKCMVEAEPWRCRRTDGKKWRCSRDVVPEHKYCERHMHRGRNRSTRPMEEAASGGGDVRIHGGAAGSSTSMSMSVG